MNISTKFLFLITIVSLISFSCSQNSSEHFFKNGSAKYQLKDYSGAIKDLSKAIELKSDYTDAYYVRAICSSKLLNYNKSIQDFNKVIELDPDYKNAYLNRAFYAKVKTNDFSGAIEDYNKYIELNRYNNNAFAFNNRGFAKFKLNDFAGAMTDVEESIKFDPKNSYAYKNRALIYIATDSLELACEDLHTAINLGYSGEFDNEVNEMLDGYCDK